MLRETVVIATLVILGMVGAVSYVAQLHAFRNVDPLAVQLQQARVHCRECGLADEETHELIETMLASRANLTREEQIALCEQQWSDDQREEMELCRPCTEAVLDAIDAIIEGCWCHAEITGRV